MTARSRKQVSFTLLEMLIVITILAVAGGALAFNVKKLYQEQKFKTAQEIVSDRLQTAQNLMLVLQSDVEVVITKNKSGCSIQLNTEAPLPRNLDKAIAKKTRLNGVASIDYETGEREPFEGNIELLFSALKHRIPAGILALTGFDGQKAFIYLNGNPHPIEAKTQQEQFAENFSDESETQYPRKVREQWQQKLEARKEGA